MAQHVITVTPQRGDLMHTRHAEPIWQYLSLVGAPLPSATLWQIRARVRETNFTAPTAPWEWNNIGALLLARAAIDGFKNSDLLDRSHDAFTRGHHLGCPQAGAHLTLVTLIQHGELKGIAGAHRRMAQAMTSPLEDARPTLVILPPEAPAARDAARFNLLVGADDGPSQSRALHAAAMEAARDFPLDPLAQRARRAAATLGYGSQSLDLTLGIVDCNHGRVEGASYLLRAAGERQGGGTPLHALHLAGCALGSTSTSGWRRRALEMAAGDDPQWAWSGVEEDDHTLLPYDGLLLCAPPSLQSITTATLLATGDWFEGEIHLWRRLLKPGMTVVDVGASLGVYTLAAAKRVGDVGRVIAVEPSARSRRHLSRSVDIENLSNVEVIAAAASNANGVGWLVGEVDELARLALTSTPGAPKIQRRTLDSLSAELELGPVDLVKIDVEGHELATLQGAISLIDKDKPIIIYENARPGGYNRGAALFLRARGYDLYRYNRHRASLEYQGDDAQLTTALNIVALPQGRSPGSLGMT